MNELARTFFALPVPEGPLEALIAAQTRMKRADTGRLPLRFTRAEQLHVTLKFLGNVSRSDIPELAAIGARLAAECPIIETRWSGVIAFGRPNRARALVVEIAAHPALSRLADELEAAVEPLGIAGEERAFRPHVTLARIKRPGNARDLLEAARLVPLALSFAELRFYESALSSDGGVYTVLQASPLAGG
jgi:2'-5' RNA ligase